MQKVLHLTFISLHLLLNAYENGFTPVNQKNLLLSLHYTLCNTFISKDSKTNFLDDPFSPQSIAPPFAPAYMYSDYF